MTTHPTREAWLLAAVAMLRPLFKSKSHIIPDNCQVSCGFASTGSKHHIGQCWSRRSSVHDRNQIFISPALLDPVTVLDTLVHELVHAVDDCQHKHGKEFIKRSPRPRAKCKDCGFEVPMYKKFLAFGPPLCPQHKTKMEPLGEWE